MPSELERAHRLHPSSLLFNFFGHAKKMILPAVMILVFASGDRRDLWFGLLLVPAAIFEVYRVLSLRYRFDATELIVTRGVFFKNERHIPFARIQNIDWTQNVLQRAVGVAEVRLETASGAEAEAVFQVLSVRHVEEMRARVFAGRAPQLASERASAGDAPGGMEGSGPDTADPWSPEAVLGESPGARRLLQLSAPDLVMLGMDFGRGAALAAVLFGVAWELGVFEDSSVANFGQTYLRALPPPLLAAALGVLGVFVLGAFVVLSLVATFLRFHGFVLERVGDDFRVRTGLLTRRSATIPRHRIQLVSVQQTLLQRMIGCKSIRIETAGGGEDEDEGGWVHFAPIVPAEDVAALVREIAPGVDFDDVPWQPLAPGARRRLMKKAVIVSLLFTTLAALAVRPWGFVAGVVIIPLVCIATHLGWRFLRYARTSGGIFFRSGVRVRRTSVVFPDKAQVVWTSENPFDRRHQMASLAVDTAGAGKAGHSVRIPYLPAERALELRDEIARDAQEARFSW